MKPKDALLLPILQMGARSKAIIIQAFAYKDGSLHDELKNHPLQTSYPKTASRALAKINFTP